MTSFRVKRLAELKDSQLKQLVDCCVEALRNDPAQRALVGGDESLLSEYMETMLRATILEGHLYVICIGPESEEQIVSTGSFFDNGKYLFDSEEQRSLGYYDFFQKLSPETQYWWTNTYPETIGPLDHKLFTREEAQTRWWCYNLATAPEHQRKGYGTAIMDAVFEKVKSTNSFMGVVPGTDLNVKIYGSMGFKEIGGTLLPAPSGDFYIHVMTRGR